jgi:centromere/kinetochore protein ZW10
MPAVDVLGQTLVGFSAKGIFPEDETVSAASIEASALPSALQALEAAKAELEVHIRSSLTGVR